MSRAVQLSATVPVDVVKAFGLEPGRTYTVQLQEGEVARLFVGDAPNSPAPDPAVVDDDTTAVPAGTVIDRPIRLENDATTEITPGQGVYRYPVWAWDPGEGKLAVVAVY